MAEGKGKAAGMRLVVSGTVEEVREYMSKAGVPTRAIVMVWDGGFQDFTVPVADQAFAKIGQGQEVTVSCTMRQHPRFGWQQGREWRLEKVGA